MSTPNRDELTRDLVMETRRASTNFVMFSELVAAKVGIHSTDNECLDYLTLNGAATAGQIAEVTGLTTGAVTAMIDRLEKAGYVSRERDKQDRRKVIVVPNEAKIYADIAPYTDRMGAATIALMGEFSEAELGAILRFMQRANEIAGQVIGEVREAE